MISTDVQLVLQALGVSSKYLRAISASDGSYTMTTAGTYNTRPFKTFLSDGNLIVTNLMATLNSDTTNTPVNVTLRVVDSVSGVLPAGMIYTMGDQWTFTSITTSGGIATLNF